MKTWPAEYARHQYARSAERRFVLTIEFSSGSFEIFTSHSGIPDIPAAAIEGVFVGYSTISKSFDPDTGVSRIGNLVAELVDKSGAVTNAFQARLTAGSGISAKRVRLYKGFAGMSWNAFQLKITQDIYQDIEEYRGLYKIACSDIQRAMRKEIFRLKKTTLDATLSATASTMTVGDNTDLNLVAHGSSYSHGPNQTWGYVQIDNEIIGYTGKTGSTELTGLARGLFNTVAVEHRVDSGSKPEQRPEVIEYVYLEMPIPKLVKALLTGVLHGQGNATLPSHWHMGIDVADLVESQFTGIGADLWDPTDDSVGLITNFGGIEEVDGKSFIEKELFLLAQIYCPVQSDGRLGMRRFTPALATAAHVATLNESNVSKHSGLKHCVREVINRVVLNWSWVLGKFRRQTIKVDANSIAKFGEAPLKVLGFKGLSSNRATQSLLNQIFQSIRDRKSAPPLKLSVTVSKSLDRIELSDVVRVQLPNVRDMSANSINAIDRAFEVQQIAEDMKSLRFVLFGSSAKVTPIPPEKNALPDAFYSSAGTELSTVIPMTGGATNPGTLTLTGHTDFSQSIYYFLGNLTISANTILQIDKNVQLRVRGTLTINGKIIGIGRGLPGVADGATLDNVPSGEGGFFGMTVGSDGAEYDAEFDGYFSRPAPATSEHLSVPFLNLAVSSNTLNGLPATLAGCSGGPGGKLAGNASSEQIAAGGTGGAGGTGLMIISRGLLLGGGASIDLSGADGQAGNLALLGRRPFYSGGGAGGAPGALYVLLDGDRRVPNIANVFTAKSGLTPINGSPMPDFHVINAKRLFLPATGYYDSSRVVSRANWSEGAYRVQFIPVPETPVEDLPEKAITFYYILATAGNAIKNGVGTLEVEAHRVIAGNDEVLTTGSVRLYDSANKEITVANGYGAGSNGFVGFLGSADISGKIVITLKDGPTGTPLDTITLVDIIDGSGTRGADGDDAVFGYVEPSNGLAFTRAANAGRWSPDSLQTDLDCTFLQGGKVMARIARRITVNTNYGTMTAASTAHKNSDLNTTRVNVTVLNSGTKAITVQFKYSYGGDVAAVAETVGTSQAGDDGLSGIVLDTRDWIAAVADPMGEWDQFGPKGILNTTMLKTDAGPFKEYPIVMRIAGDGTTPGWYGVWRHYFEYDADRSYVFYLWIKRRSTDTNKGLYLGYSNQSPARVETLAGSDETNPYFVSNGGSQLTIDKWYLAVGVIYPTGYDGGDQNIAGVYDPDDGSRIYDGTEYRWNGPQADAYLRIGLFEDRAPALNIDDGFLFTRVVGWVRDGTEPSVQAVLGAGAIRGQYRDIKFLRSASQPVTPTGNNPAGWSNEVPSGVDVLWQIMGTKNGRDVLQGVWSTPERVQGMTYRGSWSRTINYILHDVVSYQERSYICVQAHINQAPSGTNAGNAYWDLLAGKGDTGDTPGPYNQTIPITGAGPVNLRDIANRHTTPYQGGDATITFTVASGVTITGAAGAANSGRGGHGIDTGAWPAASAINLTLEITGTVRGGGGGGGRGGGGSFAGAGGVGGLGGDAIYLQEEMGITINTGGVVQGGGGAGGGGGGAHYPLIEPIGRGGGGGGGGYPNGAGGAAGPSEIGAPTAGAAGTESGGGAGGVGADNAGNGGAGSNANLSFGIGGLSGASSGNNGAGGSGGARGYAIRKNGYTSTVTNNGTITGTQG